MLSRSIPPKYQNSFWKVTPHPPLASALSPYSKSKSSFIFPTKMYFLWKFSFNNLRNRQSSVCSLYTNYSRQVSRFQLMMWLLLEKLLLSHQELVLSQCIQNRCKGNRRRSFPWYDINDIKLNFISKKLFLIIKNLLHRDNWPALSWTCLNNRLHIFGYYYMHEHIFPTWDCCHLYIDSNLDFLRSP